MKQSSFDRDLQPEYSFTKEEIEKTGEIPVESITEEEKAIESKTKERKYSNIKSKLADIEKKLKNLRIRRKNKHIFFRKNKKERMGKSNIDISDVAIKPRGTFTLKIDDKGNLMGFPIKKVQPKEEKKKGLLPFRKKDIGKKDEDGKTKEISGIKERIRGIFSRNRSESTEEDRSKISNVIGKIKGIFSRKTKK